MKYSFWLLSILFVFSCRKDKVSEKNLPQYEGRGVLLEVTGGCVRYIYMTSGLEYINSNYHETWRNSKDSIVTTTRLDTIYNYLIDTANFEFNYGDTISFKFREDVDQLGMCFYDASWMNYYPNVFITQVKKLK